MPPQPIAPIFADDFVMDVAGLELRLERHRVFAFVEPTHDSALAIVRASDGE